MKKNKILTWIGILSLCALPAFASMDDFDDEEFDDEFEDEYLDDDQEEDQEDMINNSISIIEDLLVSQFDFSDDFDDYDDAYFDDTTVDDSPAPAQRSTDRKTTPDDKKDGSAPAKPKVTQQ